MATISKQPKLADYLEGSDWIDGYTLDADSKQYYNKAQFDMDSAGWQKFQGDIDSIKNKSPLKIELGTPTKATDAKAPEEAALGKGVDFKALTSTVSKTLGINTGVQQ